MNAVADVPGVFTYTPPAGEVLPVGNNQTLTATFHPDNKNYKDASATVRINVKDIIAPPPAHQAQFLKNGDFEGGFTVAAPATAVGTYWRPSTMATTTTATTTTSGIKVWYNANHSQLIEIGATTYDPGDRPNRLSGISQTVRGLIPGERYTLTLARHHPRERGRSEHR